MFLAFRSLKDDIDFEKQKGCDNDVIEYLAAL